MLNLLIHYLRTRFRLDGVEEQLTT